MLSQRLYIYTNDTHINKSMSRWMSLIGMQDLYTRPATVQTKSNAQCYQRLQSKFAGAARHAGRTSHSEPLSDSCVRATALKTLHAAPKRSLLALLKLLRLQKVCCDAVVAHPPAPWPRAVQYRGICKLVRSIMGNNRTQYYPL